jgi:hypothetical protein
MNTQTGEILPFDEIPPEMADKFIPITRDLSKIEELEKRIKLYSPCGCGSGKKFKFCCKTNATRP